MADIMTYISFIIGIVGTILSAVGIGLTVRSNKKTREAKTIDWSQMQTASKHISKLLKRNFIPDFIITPGQKGGIFAQLIMDNLEIMFPIYTGYIFDKNTKINSTQNNDCIIIETSKWNVYLPNYIKHTVDMKVLIVDDLVMSGDFLISLKKSLISFGYKNENIKSCSIATTSVAKNTNKSPDFFWKIVDADDCYFPWGKAR